jgi:hypothetical protein
MTATISLGERAKKVRAAINTLLEGRPRCGDDTLTVFDDFLQVGGPFTTVSMDNPRATQIIVSSTAGLPYVQFGIAKHDGWARLNLDAVNEPQSAAVSFGDATHPIAPQADEVWGGNPGRATFETRLWMPQDFGGGGQFYAGWLGSVSLGFQVVDNNNLHVLCSNVDMDTGVVLVSATLSAIYKLRMEVYDDASVHYYCNDVRLLANTKFIVPSGDPGTPCVFLHKNSGGALDLYVDYMKVIVNRVANVDPNV